jgi:hypothetical protein
MSDADPESAGSAVEQALPTYKDSGRVLGHDLHRGQKLDTGMSAGIVKKYRLLQRHRGFVRRLLLL